ncbi:MAG: energy transducer TonB [Thermoflexibacter sp.]|jgi:protein TonB|nr:energy transducer TonB [Thermoflexibacter sp.]
MDYFDKSNWSKNIGLRYLLGLTVSLSLTLTAFEWKSYENQILETLTGDIEQMIDIPNNYCPAPPPPVLVQPKIIETFDEEYIEGFLLDLTSEFAPDETVSSPINIINLISNDSRENQEDELVDLDLHPFDMIRENKEIANHVKIRQVENEEEIPEEIICVVEDNAEPESGFEVFYKYLTQNIKIPTPKYLGDSKVFIQFTVEKNGLLTDFKVVKGDSTILNEENLRVLKATKWNVGKQRGIPVRQRMVLPIKFKIY